MKKENEALVMTALKYVGVHESGGNNKGYQIEQFQRSVDGIASGEPWCMAFIQYCIKEVEYLGFPRSLIYRSESVMETWNKTGTVYKSFGPKVGAIAIWCKHDSEGNPTRLGHCGIITLVDLNARTMRTIEGNTSPDKDPLKPSIDRDGDGVYLKTRPLHGVGDMRYLGCIMPWFSKE